MVLFFLIVCRKRLFGMLVVCGVNVVGLLFVVVDMMKLVWLKVVL